jgi:hypothetical protein
LVEEVSNIIFFCALNEFNLKCFEDDRTNRLIESLEVFEELIENFPTIKFEIVFSKTDILIEMIKNAECITDFENLKYFFDFDKEITFKNIVELHIELFLSKVKEENRSLINFHCVKLIDSNEAKQFFENVMDHIVNDKKTEIIYPHIFFFKFKSKWFKFNLFFDIYFKFY